jgi:hypothetical protein
MISFFDSFIVRKKFGYIFFDVDLRSAESHSESEQDKECPEHRLPTLEKIIQVKEDLRHASGF